MTRRDIAIVAVGVTVPGTFAYFGASRLTVANAMVTTLLVLVLAVVYRRYLEKPWALLAIAAAGAAQPFIFVLLTPVLRRYPPGWLIGLVFFEGPLAIFIIQAVRSLIRAPDVDLSDDEVETDSRSEDEMLVSKWK